MTASYQQDRKDFLAGTTTVRRRTEQFLETISEKASLNAFLHVDSEGALRAADQSDERFAAGLARPLEGMVVAVKDNISLRGMPLTCGSRILGGFRPLYHATVIEQLQNAGAIMIGKTNMDEFAMGSSNENSAYGVVRNPYDANRVPGGSSGGSAVATAAGMCHTALGSETGGSVRQPAAFCGTFGLKPTYGSISRYGLVAFASSLDQIGVFARTAEDAATVFDVIAGHDPMDSTSVASAPKISAPVNRPLRVGAIPLSELDGCNTEVLAAYEQYVDAFRSIGAEVHNVSVPHRDTWIPTYFILATAEASSNLARFDGIRYGLRAEDASGDVTTETRSQGFGAEVKRRIMLGTYVLSSGYYEAYYGRAQKARRMISDGYTSIFHDYDVLALPTTPTTAFGIGEVSDPVSMWLSDYFTVSANIAGIPAISIPFGADSRGLPIGMQLQGPAFSDEVLLTLAQKVSR